MNSINWIYKLSSGLKNQISTNNFDANAQIIIELNRRKFDLIQGIITSNQGKLLGEIKLFPALVATVPTCCIKDVASSKYIKKLWYDARVKANLNVAAPSIGADYAWKMGYSGTGVVVAIIDTGITPHRDFLEPLNRIIGWNDLVNNKERIYDDNGHGTHVAGIIAGNGRGSRGQFKGVAPEANLVVVKALNAEGNGSTSTVIHAIEWCINNRKKYQIKILNISNGAPAQESYLKDPLCRATTSAWHSGIFVCVAAGNDGPNWNSINSPGNNPVIMTVGNLNDHETPNNDDDQLNDTSSRGPTKDAVIKPDILAPGTEITSTWKNGRYKSLTGTSMATPMVAGAAAQIIQKWPQLKPKVIKKILMDNARNIGLKKYLQGAGVLDLKKIFDKESANTSRIANINAKNLLATILGNDSIREIIMYHIVKITLERAGKEASFFKVKRDNLILSFINTLMEERLKTTQL